MFVKELLLEYKYELIKIPNGWQLFQFQVFFTHSPQKQCICFYGSDGRNIAVGVVLIADSLRILILCIVYVKTIPVEVVL